MAGRDETSMPGILVADDDESIKVLGAMLQYAQYQVEYARDGQEALKLWIAKSYHLILMDVGMSPMDGLTATVIIRMKEQALGGYTPIIALTAETTEQARRDCFAAGMDGYLAKPVVFKELLHLIEEVLQRKSGVLAPPLERVPQQASEMPYRSVFWRRFSSAGAEGDSE